MTGRIQLTDGTIDRSELGKTLFHEHVFLGMPGWNLDIKAPRFVRSEAMTRAVDKLQELKGHGCRTLIDPCPMDLGRDVEFVAEAAQRSGMNIICATGVYTEEDGMPFTFRMMPREDIIELFMKEIVDGVGDTGIKAGVIKIASGPDPKNEYERKMIGAGAEVSRLTGVPIISHTHLSTYGHEQVDVVERNGGSANCMVVGHSDGQLHSEYPISLAKRGAFVGFDRFGLEFFMSDELRIRNLIEVVRAGYRDQLLISHDHAVCLLGRGAAIFAELAPQSSLTHIFERIIPRLIELGISQEDIEAILVSNPQRLFANAAAQVSIGGK